MYLKDDTLDDIGVFHGFFDKRRGEAKVLGDIPIITLKQIHSDTCIVVDKPLETEMQGDAMVTDQSGLAIGVYTADCVPVLFASRKNNGIPVIAAAHAGWRGAYGGVLENTVVQMESLGAERGNICAAIGPCIAQESYEVSQDFYKEFINQSDLNALFFKPSAQDGHFMFDLPAYVTQKLMDCGIGTISNVKRDTYSNELDYYSFRRATHKDEAKDGRQMSLICINAK